MLPYNESAPKVGGIMNTTKQLVNQRQYHASVFCSTDKENQRCKQECKHTEGACTDKENGLEEEITKHLG